MKHYSRFRIVCACYGLYILGDFLGEVFLHQGNKVALILMVLIPTILLLAYISMAVHSTQPAPAKKKLPVRRASTVARRNVKVVKSR